MSKSSTPIEMGNNVWLIDLFEQGMPCRTGAYLIKDEKLTLIETGSAVSHETLIRGLNTLGVDPEDLSYVIVTHVHLDHAGGAGQLMEKAKNATLVVHPRGARHMADPTRLWTGAEQVYGERLKSLFGAMVPVPESRILIRDHLDTLNIGERTLTFYNSPGHAKHHFTILDPLANALYAGDAVGIRYRTCFTGWDFEWVMPSTSPIDFDPTAVHETLSMLEQIPFQWVYHTHFGKSEKAQAISHTGRCADAMAELIANHYHDGVSQDEIVAALREWVKQDLLEQGLRIGDNIEVLDIDIILDALGLIYYETKRRQA
jgi:glyoxylase-like metal-dependent hydrolase (beta-lactamase superfamily II)